MGMMKHEYHEQISADEAQENHAADEYYSEQARQRRNKERQEKDRGLAIAAPVTPKFGGRRNYPANPATDAERFERVCREADVEAQRKGMNIVVFKNREDNYFTWEEKYISSANDIKALYTAKVK